MQHKSSKPKGPRNLKAGGFTNGLWRLNERDQIARKNQQRRKEAIMTSADREARRQELAR